MKKSRKGGSNSLKQTKKLKNYTKVEIEYLKLLRIYDKAKEDIQRQMEIFFRYSGCAYH